jgi:glycosyltransferase involved in cell wall biosynthesis
MRVALYRPFADPWRQSMRVDADQLHAHLLAMAAPGDTFELISLPGARLTPPMRYWDQYVRYQRLARRTKADVHHILDHGFAHLAAALPPRRIAVSFHDAVPIRSGMASFGTRRALEIGMRSAAARRALFLPISRASANDAIELFGVDTAAVTVVHLGVDDRFRPPVDREQLRARLGLTKPVVLLVGHTQSYMNVEGALQAAGLARVSADFEVVKVGAPLTVEQGRTAARAGLTGAIRELGIVDDALLKDWYNAADLLVYVPKLSGFGLPAIEAMASGLPVVTSSIGAVAEIAGDAALRVDPGDPSAIARAIVDVLANQTRRLELVRRGIARALDFPWRQTAAETLAVYRGIAGEA